MATQSAMCTTIRLTRSSLIGVESRDALRRPRFAARRALRGVHHGPRADASKDAADLNVSPSPSKRKPRALSRAPYRRNGAISVPWGSGSGEEWGSSGDESAFDATVRAMEEDGRVSRGEASTSNKTSSSKETDQRGKKATTFTSLDSSDGDDTELVMVLERRGEGWGEEVFPQITMRRKPVAARSAQSVASGSRLNKPNSAQSYLQSVLALSCDEAASLVSAAAAWRVTRGGRALVDRKIMRAVQSNAPSAVEALLDLGAKKELVPNLLTQMPQILALVPNDEWNANLLEYIVRTKVPGGGKFGPLKRKTRLPSLKSIEKAELAIADRVRADFKLSKRLLKNERILSGELCFETDATHSESDFEETDELLPCEVLRPAVCLPAGGGSHLQSLMTQSTPYSRRVRPGSDPLKPWVEDVRDKRQCGRLTQAQLYLLDIAGFDASVKEAGKGESNRTWEVWFDEMVEYKQAVGTCDIPTNRHDAGLGAWVTRQRVKYRQGLLPEKALGRLVNLGVSFEGYEPDVTNAGVAKNVAATRQKAKKSKAKTATNAEAGPKAEALALIGGGFELPGVTHSPKTRNPTSSDCSSVLSLETQAMICALREFQTEVGLFAEPPLGSELAVWLANVRARGENVTAEDETGDRGVGKQSADDSCDDPVAVLESVSLSAIRVGAMTITERDALVAAGVELENFSPVWLGSLERFQNLRLHVVTLHDPKAHAMFVKNERSLANLGLLSHARLMRLRHVGMSGIAGALLLDSCELTLADECLGSSEESDASDDVPVVWSNDSSPSLQNQADNQLSLYGGDGSDFGSLSRKTVAALPLRENHLAAETARLARKEKKELALKTRVGKPMARARARPAAVDAPVVARVPTKVSRLRRRSAGGSLDDPAGSSQDDGEEDVMVTRHVTKSDDAVSPRRETQVTN
jgi:hypothetical protein